MNQSESWGWMTEGWSYGGRFAKCVVRRGEQRQAGRLARQIYTIAITTTPTTRASYNFSWMNGPVANNSLVVLCCCAVYYCCACRCRRSWADPTRPETRWNKSVLGRGGVERGLRNIFVYCTTYKRSNLESDIYMASLAGAGWHVDTVRVLAGRSSIRTVAAGWRDYNWPLFASQYGRMRD